ncbi:avidin/streptavidin family protein [Marichromatium bheemlicum]|uniref:Peptidase A1 domain-containing protein n=1 Tax=Marichromatium bheemlicum TaxID=365339 RepID=A0ABX1I6D2_9GAMM|nr:avidin/streptavidin family protein [Marichromatium bheemlicum]NKN32291.1 hypothetical protein [Marichromatium bheemlicum]
MTENLTLDPTTAPDWLRARAAQQTRHVAFTLQRGPLTDNGATPWYATLGLGTPPQPLRFMLDTGTLNTWVTASCCASDACRAHRAFAPERSSSYIARPAAPTQVSFGPWGKMGVVLGEESCRLDLVEASSSPATVHEQRLDLYLSVSYDGAQFAGLACDGGLGIPAIPCETPSALLEQLRHQGVIDHAIAAFRFDAQRGEGRCLMGAVEPERFDPSTLELLPVIPIDGELHYLWTVRLDQLQIGGETLAGALPLALDTGSSCFKGGRAIIARMRAAITGHGRRPPRITDPTAFADYPELRLQLGDSSYRLTPQDYFMPLNGGWEIGVEYLEGLPDELLVAGSVFLDHLYSIFVFDPNPTGQRMVALAQPRRASLSASGRWRNAFGSTLEIGTIAADGTFRGQYRSDTGASGVYPVVGVADPQPAGESISCAFSVSWRSLEGDHDPSWHWVSGFVGTVQLRDGIETLDTSYLLQRDITPETPEWMATAIYPSTFKRVSD